MKVPEEFDRVRTKTNQRTIAGCELFEWAWEHREEYDWLDNAAYEYCQYVHHGELDHSSPTKSRCIDFVGPKRLRKTAKYALDKDDFPDQLAEIIVESGDSTLRDVVKILSYLDS